MNAPAVTLDVTNRFHGLRRKYLLARMTIATAVAIAFLLSVWLLLSIFDYLLEWPLLSRSSANDSTLWRKVAMSVTISGVAVWYLSRLVVIFREANEKQFVALVERSFDGFGQRIRTVLDTVHGRVSGPAEMINALGHQTLGRWETLHPQQLIPRRGVLTAGLICMASLFVTAALFARGGEFKTAMLRTLGGDQKYTTLSVEPGNQRILEGLPVNVSLTLSGRPNRAVVLKYRFVETPDSQDETTSPGASEVLWSEAELLPVADNDKARSSANDSYSPTAHFQANLGQASKPLEYQFVTTAGQSAIYRIDVQPLIEVVQVETVVESPQYTGLQPRTFPSRDVTVLEQSRVTVHLRTNHPLHQVTLRIGPKSSQMEEVAVPLVESSADERINVESFADERINSEEKTLWSFELPTTSPLHWQFSGTGLDGTPMSPAKGQLRIRQDRAPKIIWRDPPDEIRVHTLAEVPMNVQIADDFGIAESAIVFQLGSEDEFILKDWLKGSDDSGEPLIGSKESSNKIITRLKLEEILPLESFALTEQDFISYYAYAIDNCEPIPRRTESDLRYIDIRPLRQFFGEIELDPNLDGGGARSLRESLAEIIRRERFLINQTRRLTRSGAKSNRSSMSGSTRVSHVKLIDRMVENQSELAGLVRLLTEFLISRGNDDVEALNQAEVAMLQASDSLAAGSFDLALAQEQDALLALAEARRTLDIFLIKNPTRQQQQALARFARQLQQKLRREQPKSLQELADSLKLIANQQIELAQVASQLQTEMNGSQGTPDGEPRNQGGVQTSETNRQPESQNDNSVPKETQSNESVDISESSDPESGTDNGEMNPADQSSPEDRLSDVYARQVDLMERVEIIEEQLQEQLADSPLMTRRMMAVNSGMSDLVDQARDQQFDRYQPESENVSDLLQELSAQLDALQGGEPVMRISSLRDLTKSLANMELDLSGRIQQSQSAEREFDGNELKRLAKRISERTETIEESMLQPPNMGDLEASEVNAQLEVLDQEINLLNQLRASHEAAEKISEISQAAQLPSSQESRERATEFAEASRMLDRLYQQLVEPRLEQLRELEQQADQLAEQASQQREDEFEEDPEFKTGIANLQRDLEEAGLDELAELLDHEEMTSDQIKELLKELSSHSTSNYSTRSSWTSDPGTPGRLGLILDRLHDRIQEVILLEISSDRDAPVPEKYRVLVDMYFRKIAGESPANDSGSAR